MRAVKSPPVPHDVGSRATSVALVAPRDPTDDADEVESESQLGLGLAFLRDASGTRVRPRSALDVLDLGRLISANKETGNEGGS